ncbi:PALB2 [Branchiostoma lanceolatum]|uniref:PALB2 protein n=1 Tax=Branchiostoma lanceolatum TaxID=7740 RepID=A0A8K0AD14_BRALA|nr:PALB2 [Branchiostoma lanceolatum]
MSQNGGKTDVRQLLAHGGDASRLSEAELGKLQQQYEKLRREWSRKRRKLEKLDRAAQAKQHVRQRLQDQSLQTGGTVDTSSSFQQPDCSKDGDHKKVSDCKDDPPPRQELAAVDFQSRKTVSFSLQVVSTAGKLRIQHERFSNNCTTEDSTVQRTVPATSETGSPKVYSHLEGGDVSASLTRQGASTSCNLAIENLLGSDNNNMKGSNLTGDKAAGKVSFTHKQVISALQESSETPGLRETMVCSREYSCEKDVDETSTEQRELNTLHFSDADQRSSPDTRKKKPLFKGLSKQPMQSEKLGHVCETEREVSGHVSGHSVSTRMPNSSVEFVEEISPHKVQDSRGCEGKMPAQQTHGALADSIIVLDSQESETERSDNSHLSRNFLSKEKESTCVNSTVCSGAPQTPETQSASSQNLPASSFCPVSQQKPLGQENRHNKDVSKSTSQSCLGQEEIQTAEDSQVVAPSQGRLDQSTWVDGLMFPAEYYIRTTRGMQRQGQTLEGVARQVRARRPRKQKRKFDTNGQDASEGECRGKQARLKEVGNDGTTSLSQEMLSCCQGDEEVMGSDVPLKVAKDLKTLTEEDNLKSDQEALNKKLESSSEVTKDTADCKGVSTGVRGGSCADDNHLHTGEQVCSTPGENHLSVDADSQDNVIPDTQYSSAKPSFPLKDAQKCLKLPKDLSSEDVVQDKLHVLRKGRKAASSHNTPVPSSGLRRLVRGKKLTRSCQNSPLQTEGFPGDLREGNLSSQEWAQVVSSVEREVLYRRSRRLADRCSQETQTNASQSTPKQKVLKEVQVVKVSEQNEKILQEFQDSKKDTAVKKTRRIFPALSDRLREKLKNAEVSEFHLPYSDYGTLKVAKAREAPPADFSKNCRSRHSSETGLKDIHVTSKESSVNIKAEETPPSVPRLTETSSNRKQSLDVKPSCSSYVKNTPKNISKTELGREKKQTVFPSLSPMLHKKCTAEVLDFSLVGSDYVKLKLNKVKSSPQPAAATSSFRGISGHGKHRQQVCKAKEHLPVSSTRSENSSEEKGIVLADVESRQQQKTDKISGEDSLAACDVKNDVEDSTALQGHVVTHVQQFLETEVRRNKRQEVNKNKEKGKFVMSGPNTEIEDVSPSVPFSPDLEVSPKKVKVMYGDKMLPDITCKDQLMSESVDVDIIDIKPCTNNAAVTSSEKSDVSNSEPEELQGGATNKGGEGQTDTLNIVSSAGSKDSVPSFRTQKVKLKDSNVAITCVGACGEGSSRRKVVETETLSLTSAQDHHEKASQGTGVEGTGVQGTPVQGGHKKDIKRTGVEGTGVERSPVLCRHEEDMGTGVQGTGEEGVTTRLPEFSACLQLADEAVVSMGMGEATIQGETVVVLAVCQLTQLALWVQRDRDWTPMASWDIHKEEEVCDICLLPREVGVQLVVGGNFPSGHIKLCYTDGVSSSRLDHTWMGGKDEDGCHGDGHRGNAGYHAMTVLPGGIAIATGTCDGGSSVRKLTLSGIDGRVDQQTRLAMPAAQRIGSLQQVGGCKGCLLGTGRNQVLLWNHTTGALLRCVDLPGVSPQPTCLYAAAEQGLLFVIVSNPGEQQSEEACSLLSINPATGCSLSLQKYRLPQGSSLQRCVQGFLGGSGLFVLLDSGEVHMWDVFTLQRGAVLHASSRGPACLTVENNRLCLGTSHGRTSSKLPAQGDHPSNRDRHELGPHRAQSLPMAAA